MNESQLKGMSAPDRLDYLQNNADRIEDGEYFQSFGEEDMQQTQADLSDAAMKIDSKQEEYDAIKETFKEALKALKVNYKVSLTNLKQKGERVKGKLFLFADQETKMMNSFDQFGQLVASRRLKPEEKTATMMGLIRKAHGE